MNNQQKIYLWRTIHVIIAFGLIASIGILFYSGITQYYGFWLYFALISLGLELFAISLNKFVCPLNIIHARLGDERGFFGLFIPIRYARLAMNILIILGAFSFIFWILS